MSSPTPNPASDPFKWQRHRSPHRMRSHHEAHAQGHEDTGPPVLDHPMVPAAAPALLTTQQELEALINELRSLGKFAFDSEFIGEHSYFPKLCVIQIATPARVTLVDPLTGLDLRPFWELIADETVEKTVHAGQQDLEPVMRHLGRPPRNVIDVQIASAFAGLHYPSALGKLVKALLNADMGRGLKFSQWDHRPLSAVQLRYAADDVRYLPLLRQSLGERLESLGTMRWAMEECQSFSDPSMYQVDSPTPRLRVRGVQQLRPKQLAVMRALAAWREEQARSLDIPPRALLRDEIVLELARSPVKSPADLDRVRGLPRPVELSYGGDIVRVTAEALRGPFPPRHKGYDPSVDRDVHRPRIESIWSEIQKACHDRSIHPAIATSKKEISMLVHAQAEGKIRPTTRLMQGWRNELLRPIVEQGLPS